ncbi:UNVERIFIED_CONTAM: hypothetical protein PYX00_004419 [Menopon gallinae]|uniref:Xyloside xylosyltransferase 1 n=1 Tax=Menopon gallinae TaxID=328185 RepID=A0AAW2I448_9NEOP
MRLLYKVLLNLSVVISFLVIFFAFQERPLNKSYLIKYSKNDKQISDIYKNSTFSHFVYLQNAATVKSGAAREYNVWCIFCKATSLSPLTQKFSVFAHSLIQLSSVPLTLNVVTDNVSFPLAEEVLHRVRNTTGKYFKVQFYDVRELAEKISDIVLTMQSYFTSQPDSYYSDALFFLSIGLYRIALNQAQAVMIDVDTKFHSDVKLLFDEFNNFGNETLLGIAPEQSPVYRHVLYMYRAKYRDTEFGKPLSQHGNPGVNSGVLLLNLAKMRESDLYERLLSPNQVKRLVEKYMFHGHLGDQDWYTLLSQEHKKLIYLLDCTWNRQLCQWWNHHGYKDIFNMFYRCEGKVKISHGNCNTQIP